MDKSQIMRFFIVVISIAVAILFIFSHLSNEERKIPKAKLGVLDLAEWSFAEDGPINLYGEWSFYWKQHVNPNTINSHIDSANYIEVPSQWSAQEMHESKGYATYQLIVESIPQSTRYGLKIYNIPSSFEVYINGNKVGGNGEVGRNKYDEKPAYGPKYFFFQLDSYDSAEIVIHTSNFHYRSGGIRGVVQFGTTDQLLALKEDRLSFQLIMIGGLFLLGLYHLSIFIYRRKEITSLFFGFFCLCMALRALLVGEAYFVKVFPNVPYVLHIKIIYLSLYAAVPLLIWFFYYLIKGYVSLLYTHILSTISLFFCLIVVFMPIEIFTRSIKFFYFFILLIIVYYLYQIIKAVAKGKPGFVFLSLSAVFLSYATVRDIIYYRKEIQDVELTSLGIFIFVIGLAFVTSGRLAQTFTTIEQAQIQLQQGKEQLEKKVEERTKELRIANQQLEKLSFVDGLTNIPNRRFFDNTLEKKWREADSSNKALSLLMVDIDNFKQINDTYGHLFGDECLKKIAKLLETETDAIGKFIARYGGEEFAIILDDFTDSEAERFAKRCLKVVQNVNISNIDNFTLTISIGVATLIPHKGNKKELIAMADEALYSAKHLGKNRLVVFGNDQLLQRKGDDQ
ncbi:hypothetical protein CIB95_09440 [Lottiidibacillus patelloidae]|uniref:GGDEF domain-containing protein n=1 Tax=Lottiidibacillus patelloidae TaxID=2670334 RepID=A0A263BTD4_9BACI|nr:diguanylate cyclase [Lottiidibacillus patelloidae]OZM56983.1 hypothetical protein CIB95_09440 [Lottiidibacillus patelloidae]